MTAPSVFHAQHPIDHIIKLDLRWTLQRREGTGQFVVSQLGTLLFRIDPTAGVIYAWDKRAGREIPIRVCELFTASAQASAVAQVSAQALGESALLPLSKAVV